MSESPDPNSHSPIIQEQDFQTSLLTALLDTRIESVLVSEVHPRTAPGPEGRPSPVVYVNPGALRYLRRAEAEVLGTDARQLYSTQDYVRVRQALQEVWRSRDRRRECDPMRVELLVAGAPPLPVHITFRIFSLSRDGSETWYVAGFWRDISDLVRESNKHARLMAMLTQLDTAYFRADADGRTVETSEVEQRLSGYSAQELKGMSRARLYARPEHRRLLLEKARLSGGVLNNHLERMLSRSGRHIPLEVNLRLLDDEDGGGAEGLYRDVGMRLKLQSFLDAEDDRILEPDELFDALREHEEDQITLLWGFSHQLCGPLASIIENLRDLEAGTLSKNKGAKLLTTTRLDLENCERMARNLFHLDEILASKGVHQASSETVHVDRIAHAIKNMFRARLQKKSLDFVIKGQALREHCTLAGNAPLLTQAIYNLVDNGVKYSYPSTQETKSFLYVHAFGRPDGGSVLELENFGPHVPENLRSDIFKRGFRTDLARKWVSEGTGFGLWFVRRVLQLHQAEIQYRAVETGGRSINQFIITLPHERVLTNVRHRDQDS